jgi:hypothetical protein
MAPGLRSTSAAQTATDSATERPWPPFMATGSQQSDPQNGNIDKDLINYYRSVDLGYKQSHQLNRMFTGADLKADELTLNNNYMKLIFGGKPSDLDNIQLAYNHTIRQMADTPIEADSLLENMNPDAFVPVGEASKDSMLEAFARARQFYPNESISDAERFLKTRATHNLISTTYYNKRLTGDGQSIRHNHVRGQNDLLYRADTRHFYPTENLSSRTFAPDGNGEEVPLDAEAVYGIDPRSIKVDSDGRTPGDDMNDAGIYFDSMYTEDLNDYNNAFVSLFADNADRRM